MNTISDLVSKHFAELLECDQPARRARASSRRFETASAKIQKAVRRRPALPKHFVRKPYKLWLTR